MKKQRLCWLPHNIATHQTELFQGVFYGFYLGLYFQQHVVPRLVFFVVGCLATALERGQHFLGKGPTSGGAQVEHPRQLGGGVVATVRM
jgi:hypothetical protein